MSIPNTSEKSVDLDRQENITKGNVSAKKIVIYAYDSGADTLIPISTKQTSEQLTGTDNALITNTVMHGLSTAGGGTYVDVKVNPSGALTVENTPNTSDTSAVTSVSVTSSSTSVLASNSSRLGATISNEGAAICYLKLGTTASTTSYTLQIASGGYYEVPFNYTGAITGITSSGTAQLRISELS